MTISPVHVERRAAQRFDYHLPVELSCGDANGQGFTQDISARGIFFYTDMPLDAGAGLHITLRMPSEITLSENMRVRCRGRVIRVHKTDSQKLGVAANLEGYEYLPDEAGSAESSGAFRRISALHEHPYDQQEDPVASGGSTNSRVL